MEDPVGGLEVEGKEREIGTSAGTAAAAPPSQRVRRDPERNRENVCGVGNF